MTFTIDIVCKGQDHTSFYDHTKLLDIWFFWIKYIFKLCILARLFANTFGYMFVYFHMLIFQI